MKKCKKGKKNSPELRRSDAANEVNCIYLKKKKITILHKICIYIIYIEGQSSIIFFLSTLKTEDVQRLQRVKKFSSKNGLFAGHEILFFEETFSLYMYIHSDKIVCESF